MSDIVLGRYNSTAPTIEDGKKEEQQMDVNGNTKTTHATLNAGEDLTRNTQDTTYKGTATRITTATTTTCASGAGNLKRMIVKVALVNTVTIYNNIAGSGTILDVFPAAFPVGSYELNYEYTTGCTVVTAGADNITIVTGA